MERGGLGPAIAHADLDQDVFRRILGILHEHVEVAVVIEDAGIQQLILRYRCELRCPFVRIRSS